MPRRRALSSEQEIWRPVLKTDGVYEVSNLGRVRRAVSGHGTRVGRILKQRPDLAGRPQITACVSGVVRSHLVHRLVAEAFLGAGEEDCVVHIDGDFANSCVTNLRLVARTGGAPRKRDVTWQIRVNCSTEEMQKLQRAADGRRLRVSHYMAEALLQLPPIAEVRPRHAGCHSVAIYLDADDRDRVRAAARAACLSVSRYALEAALLRAKTEEG